MRSIELTSRLESVKRSNFTHWKGRRGEGLTLLRAESS